MIPDSPDALRAANRRSVLAMAAGMASFVANDTLVKYVSQTLPASQLIFLRGVFATMLLLPIAHRLGASRRLGALLERRVVLRALFDSFATVIYLTSLFHLPLANATAINMATPLFITVFAMLAFHEKVGPGRWLAMPRASRACCWWCNRVARRSTRMPCCASAGRCCMRGATC